MTDSLPAKTFPEFVALAKSKPKQLFYGSTGNGSPGHLNGVLLSRLVGIELIHVPYRNGAQGTTDLLTGRIHLWVAPIPTRLNEIREGRLRALAVAGEERSPDLPDIPTVNETGFGPFDASTAYAVFAPGGVSGAILQRLHSEIGAALRSEEVSQKLRSAGVEPRLSAPEEVTHVLVAEIDQWARIIRSAGIQIRE